MSNPGAKPNNKEAVFMNWLNKNERKIEIQIINAGKKEVRQDEQPTIESTVTDYKINFDPEKNLAERIVDGEKIKVNGKYMKKIYNLRKQQGRPINTEKGPSIKDKDESSRE